MVEAAEVRALHGWELRSVEQEGRELDAVITVYDVERDVGPFVETMARGVFDHTLAEHADQVKLLVGHDDSRPGVGTPVEWRNGPAELGVTYRFGTTRAAREAVTLVEEQLIGGLSVGFLPGRKAHHNEWSVDEDGVAHVVRREARLLHVGLVTTPAVADAKVLALRSLGVPQGVPLARPRLARGRHLLEKIRAGGAL